MKIIFMGTSDFGSELLQNLIIDKDLELIAIYTKEPKIAGRGKKVTKSPIHKIALTHNIKTITPKNFKSADSIEEFNNFKADLAIVVSYGLILPQEILDAPKYGCINIHPSMLPRWRGAAPMQRTIMSNDRYSAMTIIHMNKDLDAGDIIHQEKIYIEEKENFTTLSKKMSELSLKLTKKTLTDFRNSNVKTVRQDDDLATYANKIHKEECRIDWHLPAQEIIQKIRGLHGNLGAFFTYEGEKFKIFDAKIIKNKKIIEAGVVIDKYFTIQCQDYAIKPLIIQRNGKKSMSIKDLLLGFKPKIGAKLN